jgi:hypothetical protein
MSVNSEFPVSLKYCSSNRGVFQQCNTGRGKDYCVRITVHFLNIKDNLRDENGYKILAGKPEERMPAVLRKDNIKTELKETRCQDVDLIGSDGKFL